MKKQDSPGNETNISSTNETDKIAQTDTNVGRKKLSDNSTKKTNTLSINRRDWLKAGTAAAALGSISLFGSASATTEHQGIPFGSVRNAVDDLGMDPTGSTAIDSRLQQSLNRGNELVEFPPGEYRITEGVSTGSVSNWGIIGLGDSPTDVRFVNRSGNAIPFIRTNGGTGQLVRNISLDYSRRSSGSIGMLIRGNDNVNVIDVHYLGFNPTTGNGGDLCLSVQVLDSNGTGLADGIVRTGPSAITSHGSQGSPNSSQVCWLGGRHKGTLTVRNWHIENAGSNVLYASRIEGAVQVEDCLFVNNNQTCVRTSGADSYCRNSVFVVDTDNAHPDNVYHTGHFENLVSLFWESGTMGRQGALVDNCDFIYRSRPNNGRTIQILRALGSIGSFAVRNSRFQIDTYDTVGIYAQDPTNPSFGSTASRPWDVTVDGVSITGSANASNGAIEIYNRSNSVIADSCLQLTGNQDGVVISDSQNCLIENTNLDVGGQETVFSNADVETRNLTSGQQCPVPSGEINGEETGTGGSDDIDLTERDELIIHGPGRDDVHEDIDYRIDYRITYEGDAVPITARAENVKDGVLEGSVWYDYTDSFAIDGTILDVELLSDEATLEYNGEIVDADYFPVSEDETDTDDGNEDEADVDDQAGDGEEETEDGPVTSEPSPTHELIVHGPGRDDVHEDINYRIDYRIAYEGEATPITAREENVKGDVLEGSVWYDYTDSFSIDGRILDVELLSDEATLEYNGEIVDADFFPVSEDQQDVEDGEDDSDEADNGGQEDDTESEDEDHLPNVILVDGTITNQVSTYSFSVTGTVEQCEELSEGQDLTVIDGLPDTIDGGEVSGIVKQGVDAYRFSGAITRMHITGDAVINLHADE